MRFNCNSCQVVLTVFNASLMLYSSFRLEQNIKTCIKDKKNE